MNVFAIVPVVAGEPDLDWSNPPITSFQIGNDERYCVFKPGTEPLESWTVISETDYIAAGVGVLPSAEPTATPEPTMQELKENQLILMDAVAVLFETVTGGS